MLRVLTLSTLFPNSRQPGMGRFVARQTLGLARHPEVALEAVAPIGLPPFPLSLHPHYAAMRSVPLVEDREGFTVHHPRFRAWPLVAQSRRPDAIASAVLGLLHREGRAQAFDVIDAEFFWPDGPAAAQIAERLGIPFSIKARGSDIHLWATRPGTRQGIIAAGERAGGLLAVSETLREEMIALGLPAEKIRVHHTGVDLDRFAPVDRARAKAELGVPGALLVTVGNLIASKRVELAIAAAARIPGATLIVAGDGPERRRLRALARRLGIAGRVTFLGAVDHDRVASLLAAADILVHPSASEGLANVWVEALASGTPILACDVGGIRELIDRPETGRIAAATPSALATAIAELLASPPKRENVRAAAARFSWDRNRDSLFEHLKSVAGRR